MCGETDTDWIRVWREPVWEKDYESGEVTLVAEDVHFVSRCKRGDEWTVTEREKL